jgi:putative ABC transport system ATP-binding protein
MEVQKGEFVAVMGPSGSGKSTLLYMIGLMEKPTSGLYLLNNQDISRLDDDQMSKMRNKWFGFVFQSFNLFPQLNVLENIEVPMVYAGVPFSKRRKRAREVAEMVGLSHRLKHLPGELSGGELQRTAIARALSNNPDVLLADEPTGNLDMNSAKQIVNILCELNKKGVTVILVTHNVEVGRAAERRIELKDGRIA